jgi:hypothetical protein
MQTKEQSIVYCMSSFASYVANFLYQSDKGKTHHIGDIKGVINKSREHFLEFIEEKFTDDLMGKFDERLISCETVSYPRKKKDMHLSIDNNITRDVVFFMWIGNDRPKIKILSYSKGNINGLTARRYNVSLDVLLLQRDPDILIKTINHFLRTCSDEEFKDTFSGNKIPTCRLFYEDIEIKAGCDFYSDIPRNPMPQPYADVFSKCPLGYITCDVHRIDFPSNLYYIRTQGIKKGGNINTKDVIKAD